MLRRSFLQSLAAMAVPFPVSSCMRNEEPAAPETEGEALTLTRAAATNGRRFGTAVNTQMLSPRTRGSAIVAQQCSSITAEWAFKWNKVAPRRGQYQFGDADRIAGFARRYGLKMRGHTLLWHLDTPKWASASLHDTRQWDPVHEFFQTIIPRYADVVDEWDVVNEPLDITGGGDNLRQNVFMRAFGRDYIERAFRSAHQIAPRTRLFINEYGLEYGSREEGQRRLSLLRLVETLVRRGVPIHGVGLQAHLDLRKGPLYTQGIYGLVRDLAGFGLAVAVTELDVREGDRPRSFAERDRAVADTVARYLDVVLDFRAVRSVTTWGLSDRDSWLAKRSGGKADNRGLPYDKNWNRKPMRTAIERSLTRARPSS